MQTVTDVQKRINYRFRRISLLKHALSHPSAVPDSPFERLEFLGDLVLDAVVGILLFKKYPDRDEAYLTNLKSAYVNRTILRSVASRVRLPSACDCDPASPVRPDDLLEALIGAIFLDGGWKNATAFISTFILSRRVSPLVDYKTLLFTAARHRYGTSPHYAVARIAGPEHRRIFHVEARIPGLRRVGRGKATTRRAAELAAARDLLRRVGRGAVMRRGNNTAAPAVLQKSGWTAAKRKGTLKSRKTRRGDR